MTLSTADHRERYAEHARRLQTWIGAYGVGLAGLLVVQVRTTLSEVRQIDPRLTGDEFEDAIVDARLAAAGLKDGLTQALTIIGIALFLQVVVLLVNKMTQLELAHPAEGKSQSWWYRASERIGGWTWMDWIADAGSIALLSWATYIGLTSVVVPR